MTMGQSRHSDGAAEGVKQTPLSVGKRQSSVLARLMGHKLESQVGCVAEAMVRQAVQAVSSLLHGPFCNCGYVGGLCVTARLFYTCSQGEASSKCTCPPRLNGVLTLNALLQAGSIGSPKIKAGRQTSLDPSTISARSRTFLGKLHIGQHRNT